MQIEVRKRLASRYGLRHTGKIADQPVERLLHLHNHARDAPRDERHVTAKLDGVTEPLFGMQKNGPVRRVVRTGP